MIHRLYPGQSGACTKEHVLNHESLPPGAGGLQNAPGAPPSDAIVLFDGSDLSKWTGRDGAADWKVENGYMEVTRTGNIETREHFGDCQLHLEWAAPAEGKGR